MKDIESERERKKNKNQVIYYFIISMNEMIKLNVINVQEEREN